jgi:hypothetical protein
MSEPPAVVPARVRFRADDPGGLWREGDIAIDRGFESWVDGRPATPVRIFRLTRTGELLSLDDPYRRGLVEVDR